MKKIMSLFAVLAFVAGCGPSYQSLMLGQQSQFNNFDVVVESAWTDFSLLEGAAADTGREAYKVGSAIGAAFGAPTTSPSIPLYVIMEVTYNNTGNKDAKTPFGMLAVGSSRYETLEKSKGYTSAPVLVKAGKSVTVKIAYKIANSQGEKGAIAYFYPVKGSDILLRHEVVSIPR